MGDQRRRPRHSPDKSADPLDIIALGNSVGTGPKGITAPVVLINNFDELEQHKNDLKGKIVFYNYHFNPLFVETFQAYGDAVRYRGGGRQPGREVWGSGCAGAVDV
jgi:carboxypeptidase Q